MSVWMKSLLLVEWGQNPRDSRRFICHIHGVRHTVKCILSQINVPSVTELSWMFTSDFSSIQKSVTFKVCVGSLIPWKCSRVEVSTWTAHQSTPTAHIRHNDPYGAKYVNNNQYSCNMLRSHVIFLKCWKTIHSMAGFRNGRQTNHESSLSMFCVVHR